MSYAKRQLPARLVSVRDTRGETLYPLTPAPFYRCKDRPRRLPAEHPMATLVRNVAPSPVFALIHPLRGELASRVCAVMALTGGAAVVLGVLSLAGWL